MNSSKYYITKGNSMRGMVNELKSLRTDIQESTKSVYPMPYETIVEELNRIIKIAADVESATSKNQYIGYKSVLCNDVTASNKPYTNDPVHHPKHYELMPGVEVKDILHALGNKPSELTGWQEFCRGNVLKYMLRAEDKNGMEDYEKAAVYLGWLLEDYGEDR